MRRYGRWILLLLVLWGCQTRLSSDPAGVGPAHPLQWQSDQSALQESYALEAQANYPAAITPLMPLLARTPLDYLLNYRLGHLFSLSGKSGNAIAHYERAAAAAPQALAPWLALSLLYLNAGHSDRALQASAQILQRDPNNYYGLLRTIICHIQDKNFTSALPIVERALALYPLDPLFWEQKGYLLMQLNERARAFAALRYLQKIDPHNAYARASLPAR